MTSLQQDLRHVLQGMVVTLAILGAIATVIAALYLLMLLITLPMGSLFRALMIRGVEGWILLGALLQVPLWISLTHLYFVPRRLGRTMTGLMIVILLFALVGSLFIP